MVGLTLIFQIPSRDLKRLEFSGSIDPSPRPSAQPPSLSTTHRTAVFHEPAWTSIVPLHSPMPPTKSCSKLNSASQHATRTRAQTSSPPEMDHLSTMAQSSQPHTSSQTTHDTGREPLAGANSNTMNPFLRFTSKIFTPPTWAKLIFQTGINRPLREVKPTGSDSQSAQGQSFEAIG